MSSVKGLSHKKSTQGFASTKYNADKKRAAQSRGGKAKVPKGFAAMSPEKRREIASNGGKSLKEKKNLRSVSL